MEIESKFLVTKETDFQALENLLEIASYTLSQAEIQLIEDVFLDTQDKTIISAGYYLRVRKVLGESGRWVTIKSLEGFEGGTHRREEYVSFLSEEASVLECPDFRIRNMLFEITAGLDLVPLLSLKQKRFIRQVKKGEKTVAEIYLDRVNLKSQDREKNYNEFEVELKPEGTLEDLEKIRNFLLEHYNLTENPFSKFERAFLFMENLPEKTFLSLKERAFCEQLVDQKNVYGEKAKILLELDKGRKCEELSSLLKIPQTEIENLRSKFKKERLSVFPFRTNGGKDEAFHLQTGSLSWKKEKKTPEIKEWKPEQLLEYYGADKKRAEKTREYAFILFDGLSAVHGLGQEERKLLELAAFLKDIAISTSPEEKAHLSREILLTHRINGLRLHEVLMLALITELQNPCISEKEFISVLKDFQLKLPPGFQNKALTLAAIMRIGELFESSDAKPGKVRELGENLEIEFVGVETEKAIKRAERKSEFWKCLFGKKLLFIQPPEEGKVVAEEEFIENREIGKLKKSEKKRLEKREAKIKEAEIKEAKIKEAEIKEAEIKEVEIKEVEIKEAEIKEAEIKELKGKKIKNKSLKEEKLEKKGLEEKKLEKKKNKPLKKVTVKPEDSMADLACRIFSFQFSSMLSHERGTIKGAEIEELHDMRVAVRRMRAAAEVFGNYLDSEELEPHLKGLKRTLSSLGEVRDLDVFREKAETYQKTLLPGRANELDPLFALLSEEREKARKKMLDYLESEKYSRFKEDFSDILGSPQILALPTTDKKHNALPHRVRDVLPAILYARLADITAYSEWMEGPYLSIERLHRLRIASKGMRYTLEFFESVLGEDAKSLIKDFKALQDHLGDLHDSVIAIGLLRSYLRTGEWGSIGNGKVSAGKERFSEGMEGIEAYLAYKEEELQMLLDTFPDAWEKIRNGDFRRRLESSIKKLYEGS